MKIAYYGRSSKPALSKEDVDDAAKRIAKSEPVTASAIRSRLGRCEASTIRKLLREAGWSCVNSGPLRNTWIRSSD